MSVSLPSVPLAASAPLRYALAVVSVLAAALVAGALERFLVTDLMGGFLDAMPLLYTAVVISAWLGGWGPGLLAVGLATLAIEYFFSPPAYSSPVDLAYVPPLTVFMLSALVIAWLGAKRRHVEGALRRARAELEARVRERTAEITRSNERLRAEVEERTRAVEALRQGEETLRLFIEHAPVGIVMLDREMHYLAMSRHARARDNLPDDIIGKSHYEVPPEKPERWREVHRRCLAGAIERSEEDLVDRADGTKEWRRWEVRPWRDASGEIGGLIIIAVQDSGIGLEPQTRDRVFEPFFTTKPAGMGMGLSISRSIIEAYGGRLWATPDADRGATFQFTLPAGGEGET